MSPGRADRREERRREAGIRRAAKGSAAERQERRAARAERAAGRTRDLAFLRRLFSRR